jgi:hypothetical protein
LTRRLWHKWAVTVEVQLVNGQSGNVLLKADQLITLREVEAVFGRALRMCHTLKEPEAEQPATLLRPRVVA